VVQPVEPVTNWVAASTRAAGAAARVAARYANAPSYNQAFLAETPAAPRINEFVAPAAPIAQAETQPAVAQAPVAPSNPPVAESIPSHVTESAARAPRDREPAPHPGIPAVPSSLEDWENECARSRREPDLRLLPIAPVPTPVRIPAPAAKIVLPPANDFTPPALVASVPDPERDKWVWPEAVVDLPGSEESEFVEPDQPIAANLIEFPRELVAPRKMRPRRAEGPFAMLRPELQLNIFEVDPRSISTRPETAGPAALATWPEPAWAEIELEPQLHEEAQPEEMPAVLPRYRLAPIALRLRAALVDGALIAGLVLLPVLMIVSREGIPHPAKLLELGGVLLLFTAGLLYHWLFLMLAGVTPGMRYADISLCTFEGLIPNREQLRSRLGALLLSLVPVGLGIAWALFDDDHLSWHDRLSRTYLRKN